ncbi:MAG: CBS domain-containing protein [Betaproteobacteria bacterium]|nr:CBS domain-containing protein [Betaproteobacteria bacterium]
MTTAQYCIQNKPKTIFSVQSTDTIEKALALMRDNRVRAILVIDNDRLVGIVSQGDCAIKVLLAKKDPQATPVLEIMTANPLTVAPKNTLDECMAIMVHKHIRHLPVVENNMVKGVISIGDLVKNVIEAQGDHIKFLETYIKGHGSY